MSLNAPVVLFIYKRSENLPKLLPLIKKANPSKLYVIADGAKPGEENEVQYTRKLINAIDWSCKVEKNYANTNLGLTKRFSSGIDWVFSQEDRAIFIEDDCIPDPSFFRFCDELLEKYKDNSHVMTISGNNFQFGKLSLRESYYFSKYPHIWGWATWKRAWLLYDPDLKNWPVDRKRGWVKTAAGTTIAAQFWSYIFDRTYAGKIDTWDYQLTYAGLKYGALHIIPGINLVSNLGYDKDAVHTKRKTKFMELATDEMVFPLKHPTNIRPNHHADSNTMKQVFLHPIGIISLAVRFAIKKIWSTISSK